MGFNAIISAPVLASIMGDDNVRIFDCRFALKEPDWGLKQYQEGHIEGAQHADMDTQLSSEVTQTSGRHPLPDPNVFAKTLGKWGVDNQTQVIAYDDIGGAFAARLWWLMRWMGHEHVAVLDGGLKQWLDQGYELTSEEPKFSTTAYAPAQNDNMHVDIDFVASEISAGNILLLDGRPADRFTGKDQKTDPVPGHVPGAVSMPFSKNLGDDGCFLPADKLRERFTQKMEDRPVDEVITMCGSGVTACHNLLAMEVAGLPLPRLFVGSWSQWIKSGDRPVATGED